MFLCEKCHEESGCRSNHKDYSYGRCERCKEIALCYDCHQEGGILESKTLKLLVVWVENTIAVLCDSECPHCNRPINLPDKEQIESWLKGDK